jgi:hypothetical protein
MSVELTPLATIWPIDQRLHLHDFEIRLPEGTRLDGRLYRVAHRYHGRRIVVLQHGKYVWDSESCFDCDNARNKLDHWLSTVLGKMRVHAHPQPIGPDDHTPLETPAIDRLDQDHGGEGG